MKLYIQPQFKPTKTHFEGGRTVIDAVELRGFVIVGEPVLCGPEEVSFEFDKETLEAWALTQANEEKA